MTHPSPLRTNTPSGRRGLLRSAIHRSFLQHAHGFRHSAFELWITSGDDLFGPVLDIDVGPDTFVLNCPVTVAREKPAARRDHRSAVNEGRRVGRMHQAAPGTLAH